MGCWITKDHQEHNYRKLGYNEKKFQIVKMIFDDFDLRNTNQVNLHELDNYNNFIKDFFSHRVSHLKNHYELNNVFKRNNKLADIKKEK